MRPEPARALSALALVLALSIAPAARAQHPVAPTTRPLSVRMDLADAVAVASVAAVELGRIRVDDARPLAGSVPASFEVKRAPGAPPPLAAGDRAILLLRGARPPYLLVDKPEETIRLADPAAEERWTSAISAWLAVRERPSAWVPLYLDWIEGGPDTLRELAVQGLLDPRAGFQPLAPEVFARLARTAWDAQRSLPARRTAALLARFGPGGNEPLAEGLLAAPLDCDPEVAVAALNAAAAQTTRDPAPVLLRGLEHADSQVRKGALEAAQTLRERASPALRERIGRMAREEGESWLRAEAERTLAALGS
jgi:hypothetical protein